MKPLTARLCKPLYHTLLITLLLLTACQSLPLPRTLQVASKVEEMGVMLDLHPEKIGVVRRNNLLHVQVEVINTTAQDQSLSYRFRWMDAAGFVLVEEPWKPLMLHGKQRKHIQAVAPTPQADDFRIEMYSPNNSTQTEPFAYQP